MILGGYSNTDQVSEFPNEMIHIGDDGTLATSYKCVGYGGGRMFFRRFLKKTALIST